MVAYTLTDGKQVRYKCGIVLEPHVHHTVITVQALHDCVESCVFTALVSVFMKQRSPFCKGHVRTRIVVNVILPWSAVVPMPFDDENTNGEKD